MKNIAKDFVFFWPCLKQNLNDLNLTKGSFCRF